MSVKLNRVLLETAFELSDFTPEQIEEMEKGLENAKTINYANPKYSAEEMRRMRNPVQIKITTNKA